ncbi:hypothetical protein EH228_04450 [Erwinia endophytica]|uniref:hypothetical protein n=1 Tax=Erwinia endophytica TaxID=1563158 RepID=UPI001265DBCE|nr:hypothetical protein [Erwinia endophytica]KAB8312935.1 hypothetical protein EH228_04450 [Erwinia endophytica]
MSTFNLSSYRSSGSAVRHETTDKEHGIAHEVLLVAIMTYLAKQEQTNQGLIEVGQLVEGIIGKSHPNSLRIASDLINEAKENFKKA